MMHFRYLRAWLVRLAGLFNLKAHDREFQEELESHLQLHIDDNVRAGLSPQEARRQALIKLGGVVRTKEAQRRGRGIPMLEDLWQDLRYGLRQLRRNPGFMLVAIITLGLGIGANTAIFSAVNAVLLRPLPFAEQERLVVMWKRDLSANQSLVELSIPEFNDWREQNQSFERLAAMPTSVYGYGYVLTGRGEPVQIDSARVSAEFFDTLGVKPALGRAFTAEEDRPGAAHVAVLSHRLWRERFNADPNLIGQTITLNETGFEVIGVMPQDFEFPRGADIWSPLSGSIGGGALQNRQAVFLQAVGRLKPGVTPAQAEAELNTIIGRVAAAHPETDAASNRVVVTPLVEYIFGNARPALWMLLAATWLLLAVACANVANLLLARATSRRREIAVRAALGASRARIVRQLFAESLLLAISGAGLGVLLASWLLSLLGLVAPADLPRIEGASINLSVFAFTTVVALLTAFIFGLAPALNASKVELTEALGGAGGGKMSSGQQGNRLRGALVVAEVALTLVLLIMSGLVLRSFAKLQQIETGFDRSNVLTFQLRLYGKKYPDAKSSRDFFQRLRERLEAQPGVLAAGAVLIRPLEGAIGWDVPYATANQSPEEAKRNRVPNFEVITPHYFDSVGVSLKAGRDFTEHDDDSAPKVAIISEAMAHAIFPPGTEAVGQRIRLFEATDTDDSWYTVAGVVSDARYRDVKESRWDVYVPHRQFSFPVRYVTVRTASDPAAFAEVVRREVAALDPGQAVTALKTTTQLFSESVARPRFNTLLLSLLSLLAAILAAVGIYGVMNYAVVQRKHELGIRMALGARPRDVLRLVIRQGMLLAVAGIGLGLGSALLLMRVIAGLLYGVTATDPLTFTVTLVLLLLVAFIACFIPAWRATRIDPQIALRHE